jgi:hypothetical protein
MSDLEKAVDLTKDLPSGTLFGAPVTGDADQASRAAPRIKNALGHAIVPP